MKQFSKYLFFRSDCATIYYRRRIPKAIRAAYPPEQENYIECLHTSDRRLATQMRDAVNIRVTAEFSQHKKTLNQQSAERSAKRLEKMSDEQLKSLADYWVRQVLLTDDHYRELDSEEEFENKGSQMDEQRAELGRMLAMRRSDKILPAMHSFIYLCGLEVDMSPQESKRAGTVFLTAVCTALDLRIQRQRGEVVQTDKVAPAAPTPRELATAKAEAASAMVGWDEAFAIWRDYVPGRPKSTAIATQTPYLELKRMAAEDNIHCPGDVTSELMRKFVDRMAKRGLGVVTVNERIAKLKALFKVLKGKGVLTVNPAADTLGLKENSFAKRKKKRLPFDRADVVNIFSSPIFNEQQLRSQGQAAESTYWIPVLMYYTGARPEEVAGLALADIVNDPVNGWYFNIIDRPSPEDGSLEDETEDGQKPSSQTSAQWRKVKNFQSIRKVPVAQQLIDLGLFRYVEWCRAQGHQSLFTTLKHDWHGKLSGAFSKFFGRYKVEVLGIESSKKVLYSFRHTMKDAMTLACIPSKFLQRILGHASGDGEVTDGYGCEDVPIGEVVRQFQKIQFFDIPALPWTPGKGGVKLRKKPLVNSSEE